MFLITATKLIERVRAVLHDESNSGAYTDEKLYMYTQFGLEDIYEDLQSCVDGPGRVQFQVIIDALNTNGYVPGSRVPVPSDLLRTVIIRRNCIPVAPGSPDRRQLVDQVFTTYNNAGYFWIDGPNQLPDPITGDLSLSPAVYLFTPALQAGEQLEIIYTQQCPQLLDANNDVNVVQLDLLSAAIAQAVASLGAAYAVARDDSAALGRARQEAAQAIDNYNKRKIDIDNRPSELDAYAQRRRNGYY